MGYTKSRNTFSEPLCSYIHTQVHLEDICSQTKHVYEHTTCDILYCLIYKNTL